MSNDRFRNVYLDNHSHFCTASIVDHLPLIDNDAIRQRILKCWDKHRERWQVRIEGFVLMPTHIHILVRGTAEGVQKFMQYSLAETSRQIRDAVRLRAMSGDEQAGQWLQTITSRGVRGKVWQERFRCLPMDRERAVLQKLEYIHMNPVRAGLVAVPEDWPWSSWSHYAGEECVFRVDTALAED